ncbi:hypothetical protein BSZ35_08030 [Salinibacter sp. 10B]|uniref:J domain-containing protein n=1 Tax=Salinibacter sp. 10B TaxID=1923971 RepID=UPI000CF3A58E|nr:J domain-containing protein [Salinibacter sp. 10B]PQJ34550.1 hypothetical protein BSZ35_08030 [Salinibacter sp. 10B]
MSAQRTDLQHRLAERQREKAELERQLHAAHVQYQEEVAPLEEKVLRLRVEHLRRAAQRHMRSAKHRNAYHDAQRAYESFQEERRTVGSASHDTLKRRYRQASKRCHPDAVPDAYRAQAAATFQALESAYKAGHAEAVQAIAAALEQWGFPEEAAEDRRSQRRERDELRRAVSSLETAIEALRDTDLYRAVAERENVDAVLRAKKNALLQHLLELRHQARR